ncbi:aa3-type cytochrome oxidase subunit CtaJ [Williamsia sp. SKLECPSW1]
MEDLIIAIGLPVTIICIIMVVLCVLSMAWAFGSGHKPAVRYTLDKEWDRDPLLFSAVDVEPVAPPAHHEPSTDELTGGSAHGKW